MTSFISNLVNFNLELSKKIFKTDNTLALYTSIYDKTNLSFHKFIQTIFDDKQKRIEDFLGCIDFAKSSSDYRRYFNLVSKDYIDLNKNDFIKPNEIMNLNMYAKANLANSMLKISGDKNYTNLNSIFMQLMTERMMCENEEITDLNEETSDFFEVLHKTDICYYSALISFALELKIITTDEVDELKKKSSTFSMEQSTNLLREIENKNTP